MGCPSHSQNRANYVLLDICPLMATASGSLADKPKFQTVVPKLIILSHLITSLNMSVQLTGLTAMNEYSKTSIIATVAVQVYFEPPEAATELFNPGVILISLCCGRHKMDQQLSSAPCERFFPTGESLLLMPDIFHLLKLTFSSLTQAAIFSLIIV